MNVSAGSPALFAARFSTLDEFAIPSCLPTSTDHSEVTMANTREHRIINAPFAFS